MNLNTVSPTLLRSLLTEMGIEEFLVDEMLYLRERPEGITSLLELQELQRTIQHDKNVAWEGRTVEVLVDAFSRRTEDDVSFFRHGASHEDWHVRMVCATVLAESDREEDTAMLAVLASDPVAAVAERARNAFRR